MKSNSPTTLIVSVLIVCVVAAAGLAATYAITAPRIAEQDKAAETEALAGVFPDAATFEPVDAELLARAQKLAGDSKVDKIYRALDKSGAQVGWGVKVGSRGYGGYINLVLGLDSDGKVAGLTILSMNETPGLGSRIKTEPWFIKQFTTLPAGYTEKDVKALDTISGATKSSRGVRNSLVAAAVVFDQVLKDAGEVR